MTADEVSQMWGTLSLGAHVMPSDYRVSESSVETDEGPLLLAIDNRTFRHLLVPVGPAVSVPEDRRSRGVQISRHALIDQGRERVFVDVICLRPDLNSLFDVLVAEMIEAVSRRAEPAPLACRRVLDRWRDLLSRERGRVLSLEALAGIFGELVWLREIVRVDPNGLTTWKGPDHARHDFVCGATALEAKTSLARSGRTVEIHGHDQMEPPAEGTLYLGFTRLQEDSTGESVPELVGSIIALSVDSQELISKLAKSGYDLRDSDAYSTFRFRVIEQRLYKVDDAFPKITSSSFTGAAVPPGVSRITYQADLTNEPPAPLSEERAKAAILSFSKGERVNS